MSATSQKQTWTVGRLIQWSTGHLEEYQVGSPRLSAELMLARVLDCRRVDLYLRFDQPLAQDELDAYKALLLRRRQHEPVAYLVGRREFFSLELEVGPGVLVPRPETELLVEEGLARLKDQDQPQVVDLCTGSGAVALALAANLPGARVMGVDLSPKSLAYARRNARRLGLEERLTWLEGPLFEPLAVAGGFVDLITANPPYVSQAEYAALPREVRDYEPSLALLGGEDGLDITRQIIRGAGSFLRPLGWLLVELGAGQAPGAMKAARDCGHYGQVETAPDLAGIQRVLICRRSDYG